MSAIAMPFDPTLTLGMKGHSFTWPGHLEPSMPHDPQALITTDLSSFTGSPSEASLTPPSTTRSLTSSPPHGSFTPEQRELKKFQERARRESRLAIKVRRSESQSYVESPGTAISMTPDAPNALEMSMYTTAPQTLPLVTDSSSLPAPAYLTYSPPMSEPSPATQMFTGAYQPAMSSNYGVSMDYSGTYGASVAPFRSASLPVGHDNSLMYQMPQVATTSATGSHDGGHVRVVQSRPKPRCWEHGCNGRQFSTFSNLLRHQREKSGQATKATCPNCHAEFTRTTARNGHLLHDKCKQRRNS